jgi:hypothetical protein
MSPYELRPTDPALSQGDILNDCPLFSFPTDGWDVTVAPTSTSYREQVIVLTQACDLAQAKTNRAVVAVLHPAESLVSAGFVKASVVKDQVRRGQVFGLYYLPASDLLGLPESLVDLRDLHTVPLVALNRLIATGKRVGRLITPYREHLAQHFAVTYMRIALPEAYETRP